MSVDLSKWNLFVKSNQIYRSFESPIHFKGPFCDIIVTVVFFRWWPTEKIIKSFVCFLNHNVFGIEVTNENVFVIEDCKNLT